MVFLLGLLVFYRELLTVSEITHSCMDKNKSFIYNPTIE